MEEFSDNLSFNIFKNLQNFTHEEYQYLNIIDKIIEKGNFEEGRNGNTKSLFGEMMRFSLQNNCIPLITTKKTAWKTCLRELLWFIKGETDSKILERKGVHIWDGNSSREYLDSRGLLENPEGILGPIYGFQWRFFNANYNNQTGKRTSEYEEGTQLNSIDQLQQIIDLLRDPKTRNSRRLILSAWNPCQLDQMALPPCHILCQFYVHSGNKLSCALYQRSADIGLGVPFNIASYSFLTHLIAKHCDLEAFEFIHFMGNVHIYEDHLEIIKEQLNRNPYKFPTLSIKEKKENINDYHEDDFIIQNYICHDSIKMKMIV
jgi:thymidylate synthase